MAKELAAKLSEMGVELEESKQLLSTRNDEVQSLTEELQVVSNNLIEEVTKGESVISSLRDELDVSSQQLLDQLVKKDLELASLKDQLSQSEARLTEQFLLNEDTNVYKNQAELASSLQQELQLAQDMISHLRVENSQLKEMLSTTENRSSVEPSGSESSDEDEKGLIDPHIPNGNTDNEDGEVHIKRLPPDVIPVQATEHMMEEAPPYMNGNLSEGESPVETDSSEDMNMAPHRIPPPPPLSKYTNREDMVDSLSASIRQLEMERDQLTDILHRTQDQQEDDFQRLQQHLELQLKQQLQQQYRQARFMKLMNEKASLIERIQELEHITVQLSHETETIGEYITLYQTQRNALKSYYKDRERLIAQLSSEKANMQEKMNQLQDLVKRMLDERKELRIQQHQLQNVINSRMVAHEHQSVISAYQDGDEVILPQVDVSVDSETNSQNLDDSDRSRSSYLEETETELSQLDSNEDLDQNDGTARQILQILEQLGPSEEGTHKGWISPDVRTREFLPCRSCGGRVLRL